MWRLYQPGTQQVLRKWESFSGWEGVEVEAFGVLFSSLGVGMPVMCSCSQPLSPTEVPGARHPQGAAAYVASWRGPTPHAAQGALPPQVSLPPVLCHQECHCPSTFLPLSSSFPRPLSWRVNHQALAACGCCLQCILGNGLGADCHNKASLLRYPRTLHLLAYPTPVSAR